MPDVFISYKRERRPAAEHLAAILKSYGYDVWFDYALIRGRDFAQQIDQTIRSSKVLLALWCTKSVGSRWVHEEVDLAQELGILIPAKIEPCELPVGNRRLDCLDLTDWDGAPRSHHLDDLLIEIARRLGQDPKPNFMALKEYESLWRRFGAQPLTAFALDTPIVEHQSTHAESTSNVDSSVRDLSVLRDIWTEVKPSENLDRLGRFLDQVRGTPLESAVEERIESVERALTTDKTADWHKKARPTLARIKKLYATMGWSQGGPKPDGVRFVKELRLLIESLPPVPENTDVVHVANILNEHLNTKIHHGLPIPDDYTLTAVFPLPGSLFGQPLKRVKACLRPGIDSDEYNREGFGGIAAGLIVSPEIVFQD